MTHLTHIWVLFQADTIITFQGRHGRFLPGKTATVEATSLATLNFAKSRQDLGLGGFAFLGGPAIV